MNLNNLVQSPPKDAVYDIVQQQYVDVESDESKELKAHREWVKRFYDEFHFFTYAMKGIEDKGEASGLISNFTDFLEYAFDAYLYTYYDKADSLSATYFEEDNNE